MKRIIGLDVSKQWLDVCIYTDGKAMYYRFLNNESGHQEFINLIRDQDIKLIVCEPTGGYGASR